MSRAIIVLELRSCTVKGEGKLDLFGILYLYLWAVCTYSWNFRDPTRNVGLGQVMESYGGVLKDADMKDFRSAYVNPEAGWADAGIAVKVMIEESIKAGLEYKVGKAVDIVSGARNRVKGVRLSNGELIEADKVILSTGAWTSSLLSGIEDELGMTGEQRVEQQLTAAAVCVAHYQLSKEEMDLYTKMPVIVYGEKGTYHPHR
jgi:sarcosine oxidase / L-pipecolate oxidase